MRAPTGRASAVLWEGTAWSGTPAMFTTSELQPYRVSPHESFQISREVQRRSYEASFKVEKTQAQKGRVPSHNITGIRGLKTATALLRGLHHSSGRSLALKGLVKLPE